MSFIPGVIHDRSCKSALRVCVNGNALRARPSVCTYTRADVRARITETHLHRVHALEKKIEAHTGSRDSRRRYIEIRMHIRENCTLCIIHNSVANTKHVEEVTVAVTVTQQMGLFLTHCFQRVLSPRIV